MFHLEIISASIRMATPLMLASLGGVFSERSGVVNIALEGMMLNGAFAAVVATHYSGNPWVGLLAAVLVGLVTALIHGLVTITFKADHIVSGVAVNLLALGATQFTCWVVYGNSGNSERVVGLPVWRIPLVDRVPVLGHILSGHSPLVYMAILLVLLAHFLLFKTVFGLRLRAVGEDPLAADTMGIKVTVMRYWGVLISGVLAGLGGAFLSLNTHYFVKNMSGGRGFIALAAMIFGKWTSFGAAGACLLFGFLEALQMSLQGGGVPTQFIQMIPYLATMVVLTSAVGRATPPAAVGRPYLKETE
ncbi:ABC transporter permease [bacterium]|nr:ABC transporter permease [bacterium]